MKFSYQWLSELVDGARPDPVELGRAITMKTAECEGVELVGEHLARVAVARVLSVEPIPGSHNQKAEIEAAEYIAKHVKKPCAAFIAGQTAPPGKRMGHAGAIISGSSGSAEEKMDALRNAGVEVAVSPGDMGVAVQRAIANRKKK